MFYIYKKLKRAVGKQQKLTMTGLMKFCLLLKEEYLN